VDDRTAVAATAARSRCREPDDEPYDGDAEEPTPEVAERKLEPCKPCGSTGRIHVTRGGKDADRGRRCPLCRGRGFRFVDPG
jgi:hypothetical protein